MTTFYWYPKCTTCKKAKKWLDDHKIAYTTIDMIENPPSEKQLLGWMNASDLPLRRFFNSSGMKYREQGLKDKVDAFTPEEAAKLLATDGMLIKRPIIVTDAGQAFFGFKEEIYEENLK